MPVPLDPFVDVVKSWFTESLGYLINDSVPVKPKHVGSPNTASDIDLVCKHPLTPKEITFDGKRKLTLHSSLLVEWGGPRGTYPIIWAKGKTLSHGESEP